MNPNMSNFKKFYLVFLIFIGLSNSLLYLFSVGYRKSQGLSMHSLRPFYAIGTSPLPLVFDTKSFFSSISLQLNYTDSTSEVMEIDSHFLQAFQLSRHLKLHLARYSFTGLVFDSKKLNSIYCDLYTYQNLASEKKISSFTISTYFDMFPINEIKKPLTTFTKNCL